MSVTRIPLMTVALALLAGACDANTPTYFPAPAPLEAGGDATMPAASVLMTLPFRRPSAEEAERRSPWLSVDDVALSVLYSITNLSDREGSARLTVDGASEFTSYDAEALRAAAIMADPDEEPTVLALIRPTPLLLAPGETRRGVVREDDFAEAALDLDAIGRFGANPLAVLVNVSAASPIGLEMIPPGHVRPALFRVHVHFAATVRMRLEILVRVRDQGGRLTGFDDENLFAPDPPSYMPPPPPAAP
jgi:hypothetical protein